MNEKNYLMNKDGLQKIRDFLEAQKTVMMATQLGKVPFSVCPMTFQQMDGKGDLWFVVSKESDAFEDIEHDNRVQIIYADDKKEIYLSIFGNATHVIAEQKREELWNSDLLNWFEGKDDPDLALLSVNMVNSFYWDTTTKKLISFS